MKKNILKSFGAVLFFCLIIPCFHSCSDDLDGCGLTVIVKDAVTSKRMPNATVTIYKAPGDIKVSLVSDGNGEAYFFFKNEAIFDVEAKIGEVPNERKSVSSVKLKYDEVVTLNVLLP